jgi:hypothetical protein
MRRLVATTVLGAIALVASAFAAAGHRPAPTSVHSSALLLDGRVRCSVSIATPALVGQPLRVRVRLHNLSDQPVQITLGWHSTWLRIKGSGGRIFDTRDAGGYSHGGPRPFPTTIAAGATVPVRSALGFRVRWSGPLRITPDCAGTDLPALRVPVARTAAPVSGQAAVAAVIAASGHLLDGCRPSLPGDAVDGVLEEPRGAAPAMPVRCSVRVTRKRGFDVAQELVVTPARLKVHLRRPYGQLTFPRASGNWEAIAWQFVVTRAGAVPVASSELNGQLTVKHRRAPEWSWTRSGPSNEGTQACIGGLESISGGNGPDVLWVSACR